MPQIHSSSQELHRGHQKPTEELQRSKEEGGCRHAEMQPMAQPRLRVQLEVHGRLVAKAEGCWALKVRWAEARVLRDHHVHHDRHRRHHPHGPSAMVQDHQ